MSIWLQSLLDDWKERFTPYRKWMGQLKNPQILKADIIAGLTVALIAIPQSMAYAQLAGLPAYMGLYASFLPVIVAALFGSSHQLSTGTTAMASLMSATALQPYAAEGVAAIITYSALLAIMIGMIRLSLGLLHLGMVMDFLSQPVVVGFTNAAALIIATSQIPKLFGVPVKADAFDHYHQYVWNLLLALPQTQLITLAMGAFSLGSLLVLKTYAPRLPGILIVVTLSTLLSWQLGYHQLGGSIIGAIPQGLPELHFPAVELNFGKLAPLLTSALIIGLMGLVEAVSISKAIAAQTRQRWSVNQELVGQGLANITSGLFQGLVVSGSFSRSAVNFSAGARTGFASIVTGMLVAITLLFLTDLLYYLPQSTLGAIIIMAVFNLFNFAPIHRAWLVEKHDGVAAVVTFTATLVFAPHLELGIMLGIVLSLGLFLYRTTRPSFFEVGRHADGTMRNAKVHGLKTSDTVSVFRFNGDLYFGNTGYLEGKLLNTISTKPNLKVVVMDMEGIGQVDATGEAMLERMADQLQAVGIEFYFARTNQRVYRSFQRSGLMAQVGKERFFLERKYALNYAKQLLGEQIDITPLQVATPTTAPLTYS
ncbi:SulP family inorganic anion transporter [Thiofilum flexile]|uniref:SulP family inorganic anion transporter n=1 Tax=Thiofilum flexile TaxID=125627 RepID=UPI00039A9581|nr:SulP family inorganic anion transporter [Thiofilum flexile]